jgi:hypothetical protein
MALQNDIDACLVVGNSVTITIRYNPGAEYTGEVDEVKEGAFRLRGKILNQYEHFSNISADPIYRMYEFNVSDIESIKKL